MTLHVHRHRDAATFLDAAGPFLLAREAENTLPIGTALNCRERTPEGAGFWTVSDGDRIVLAAAMVPPTALVLSEGDAAALPVLITALDGDGFRLPGVVAAPPLAEGFAQAWTARTAMPVTPVMTMTLHHLTAVAPLPQTPGALRPAVADDVDWIADWMTRFIAETGLPQAEAQDTKAQAARGIERGRLFVWEDDGRPVAMASASVTAPGRDGGRIGLVRTDPALRSRGYATACVGALSRRLLAQGWRYCLILTDDRNPVTGRIYGRVGYRAIGKVQSLAFAAEA